MLLVLLGLTIGDRPAQLANLPGKLMVGLNFDLQNALLAAGGLAVAIVSIRKILAPAWRWCRRAASRVGAALDTLGGRPPIVDRVTGKEISPEVPPLGIVLADMSQRLDKVADVNDRLDRIEGRVETVESTVSAILADKWETGAHAALEATKHVMNVDPEETP